MRWLQTIHRRTLKVCIVVLLLAALVDSYALVRAYGERNADTVIVVVIAHFHAAYSPLDVPVKPRATLRYTGATVRKIQQALEFYPYQISDVCLYNAGSFSYEYQLTFMLDGMVVETANRPDDSCTWKLSSLGLPEHSRTDAAGGPVPELAQLTHGTFPTEDHPVLATSP